MLFAFRTFLNTDTNPSLHFTSPAQPETLHLFHDLPFSVVLACFFTIPAELLMVRLTAGLEHGRVYANVGGVTISDSDCYMLCSDSPIFQWSFFIHKLYIRRRKQWSLRLTVCNFHMQNSYYKIPCILCIYMFFWGGGGGGGDRNVN